VLRAWLTLPLSEADLKRSPFRADVDLGIVRNILDNHLQDLLDFVSVIRPRVP
jgi:hypothetical protein